MEEKEKSKIARIMAEEDKQLEVDATYIASEIKTKHIEKMSKPVHRLLVEKELPKYPKDIEKQREEKRKYTQTFSEKLEEEKEINAQKRKIEIQKREQKLQAYKKQESYVEEIKEDEEKDIDKEGIVIRIKRKIGEIWNGKIEDKDNQKNRVSQTHQDLKERVKYEPKKLEEHKEHKEKPNIEKEK